MLVVHLMDWLLVSHVVRVHGLVDVGGDGLVNRIPLREIHVVLLGIHKCKF